MRSTDRTILARWILVLTVLAGSLWQSAWAQNIVKINNATASDSDTTSTDGRIPKGSSGRGDDGGSSCPTVIKDGNTYKMWYAGGHGANQYIYYATSTNGLDWTKYNNATPGTWANTGDSCTDGRLFLGSVGADTTYAYSPYVIKDGNTYKMWYSGYNGSGFWILHATSPDGLIWTKKNNAIPANSNTTGTDGRIPQGTSGGDSVYAVYSPCVIKDGNTYKMWYQGYNGAVYNIYYATSPDGLTWTKYDNTTPSVSDTTGTNGRIPSRLTSDRGDYWAMAPSVIKNGMSYLMWYTGWDGASYRIYHATSQDGLTWTKKSNVVPSPSDTNSTLGRIALGTTGRGDVAAAQTPNVLNDGRTLRFWYSGNAIYSATWVKDFPTIENSPVTTMAGDSATLAGNLISTGQAPATVRVYWDTTDAGQTLTGWAHTNEFTGYPAEGALNMNVTGLVANTIYLYRFYATNQYGFCMSDPIGALATAQLTVQATDAAASEVTTNDTATFTITRPLATTNFDLTAYYTLSGSASNGVDYAALSGSAIIPAGTTTVSIVVSPLPDGLLEGTENVILTLAPGGYLIGSPNSATATIADVVWYVSTNGLDSNGGSSWGDAFATVSNGVAHANLTGGLLLVSNGVYLVSSQIVVTNAVTVRGAAGDRGVILQRDTAYTNRIFTLAHSGAALDSLTLTNGTLYYNDGYGGGILMSNGTIRNCNIVGNSSVNEFGGGIYMVTGLITNSLIAGNTCWYSALSDNEGGGIYMLNGTVTDCIVSNNYIFGWSRSGGGIKMVNGTVANCVIVTNRLAGDGANGECYGGGIRMLAGTVQNCLIADNTMIDARCTSYAAGGAGLRMDGGIARRCIIRGNYASGQYFYGGGVSLAGDRLENCLVYGNYSDWTGGGVFMPGGQILNCTIVSNTTLTTAGGGGLYMTTGGATNLIVYFNNGGTDPNATNVLRSGGTVAFSCSTPLISGGNDTNNISTDPSFVTSGTNTYHLRPGSPCIDAGVNLALITNDLAGRTRPLDGNSDRIAVTDMGAYEYTPPPGTLVLIR